MTLLTFLLKNAFLDHLKNFYPSSILVQSKIKKKFCGGERLNTVYMKLFFKKTQFYNSRSSSRESRVCPWCKFARWCRCQAEVHPSLQDQSKPLRNHRDCDPADWTREYRRLGIRSAIKQHISWAILRLKLGIDFQNLIPRLMCNIENIL